MRIQKSSGIGESASTPPVLVAPMSTGEKNCQRELKGSDSVPAPR